MPWNRWVRTIEVEPSLYAGDFARLGEQVEVLCRAGARIFHFDIGDGHFVEPVTMGPVVLQSIAPIVHRYEGVLDVHLMVDQPEHFFAAVAAAGGDSVTFHHEVARGNAAELMRLAREQELQVGLAFNPQSEPEEVATVADGFDLVLCMGIHPGYSGQPFLPGTIGRVERLRALLPAETLIQVDGGVGPDNLKELYDAGSRLFVAGSAIFGREDLPRAYRRLVQMLA